MTDWDDAEGEGEFVHKHSFSDAHDTSRDAAAKAYGNAEEVKLAVHRWLTDNGRNIDQKIIEGLSRYPESTVRPRRGDAVTEGKVRQVFNPDGTPLKWWNDRGNDCNVWEAVPEEEWPEVAPRRKRGPRLEGDALRDAVIDAIVETLTDRETGAGSNLEECGEREGMEPWLFVYGEIDIGQLANVVIETIMEGARV